MGSPVNSMSPMMASRTPSLPSRISLLPSSVAIRNSSVSALLSHPQWLLPRRPAQISVTNRRSAHKRSIVIDWAMRAAS